MEEILKSVALRFVRVFAFTALTQMAFIASTTSPDSWGDFGKWALMLVVSGVSAGLTALDKGLRDYASLSKM